MKKEYLITLAIVVVALIVYDKFVKSALTKAATA